ncbi:MAG: Ig-like domain-containing protein, partial [Candidatus Acidiferrales bacterium]
MRKNIGLFALVAVAMAGSMILTACGGGGGGTPPTTNDLVIVPGSASVPVSQSGQFSAYLAGVRQSATWTASGGTIDNTGLFMAPSAPGSVTITATSGSNTGTTTVQVVAAQPVAVSPAVLTVPAGATQT